MATIIDKIGRIGSWREKEESCKYVINVFDLIKAERDEPEMIIDEIIDRAYKDFLPKDNKVDKDEFVGILNNQHGWIDKFLLKAIQELGREYTGIEDYYYKIGYNTMRNPLKKKQYLLMVAGNIFPVKTLFTKVEELTPQLTDSIEMKIKSMDKNSTVVYRKTRQKHKDDIMQRMQDKELFLEWLLGDCAITRGVFEGISELKYKPEVRLTEETKCEGRGDDHCLYRFSWASESPFEKVKSFFRKLYTLDHHFEKNRIIFDLEQTIQKRTEELEEKTIEEQRQRHRAEEYLEKVQELMKIEEKLNQELRIKDVLQTSEDVGAQILHENKNLLQPLGNLTTRSRRLISKTQELVDIIKSSNGHDKDLENTEFLIEALDKSLENADYAYREIIRGYEDFRQVYNPREEGKMDLNRDLEACTNLMFDRNYLSYINVEKDFSQVKVPAGYDSRQFNRGVFLDIFKNARDAIVEQKSKADENYKGRLLVRSETRDDKTIISVYDNGIGIQEGYEEKMFQKKESTKASGTGLGLFTARFILDEKKCGKIYYEKSDIPEYKTKIVVELDLK